MRRSVAEALAPVGWPPVAEVLGKWRNHYLRHLIPAEFYDQHLADSEWFELAPGERPEDLEYPDSELIADITPDVMRCLLGAEVFAALDDALCPADPTRARQRCYGDYRHARSALLARGFREGEAAIAIARFCITQWR